MGREGVYRRAGRKGYGFTVMVAGERCLGKTTLVETLFGAGTGSGAAKPAPSTVPTEDTSSSSGRTQETVQIEERTSDMTVDGTTVKLTLIDTPGFGDSIDTRNDVDPLCEYIDGAFREYLAGESQADRSKLVDRRVHCLLYFLRASPTGLSALDLAALRQLHSRVNVVPLLAKADTLTLNERHAARQAVRTQLATEGISVFNPGFDPDDPPQVQHECQALGQAMPFAVIGSLECPNGGGVRGRKYHWGVAEVDNPAHCDVGLLKRMLIETHLHDLRGLTEEVHYETFRKKVLESGGVGGIMVGNAAAASPAFAAGRSAEEELRKKHEHMKKELEEQARLLEEKRRQFEEERKLYDEAKRSQNLK
eukprot:m.36789 g.36789  ORF g.36789 m.36789 type:complete len:365 (-) comp5441_c0_seq1:13-1107(-)